MNKMSGINHRLFSNNNSTETHWYPNHGGPIPITGLSWNHLAAIVDLYESEAVKFVTENFYETMYKDNDKKRHSTFIQSFLKKHVKSWTAIKARETFLRGYNYPRWKKLFIDRNYSITRETEMQGRRFEIKFTTTTNQQPPTPQQEFNERLALINFKVLDVKLKLADLEQLINKLIVD